MAIDLRRKSDIKLLAGATVAVLLVGFFIAGAMIVTTRGGSPQCGQLRIGLASAVRNSLTNGPYFQSGGGDCGFWLALDNDDIAAFKAIQPSGCTLTWKLDHWECDGETVPQARLARYPVNITTQRGIDVVIVNLGTPQPSGAPATT